MYQLREKILNFIDRQDFIAYGIITMIILGVMFYFIDGSNIPKDIKLGLELVITCVLVGLMMLAGFKEIFRRVQNGE